MKRPGFLGEENKPGQISFFLYFLMKIIYNLVREM